MYHLIKPWIIMQLVHVLQSHGSHNLYTAEHYIGYLIEITIY